MDNPTYEQVAYGCVLVLLAVASAGTFGLFLLLTLASWGVGQS